MCVCVCTACAVGCDDFGVHVLLDLLVRTTALGQLHWRFLSTSVYLPGVSFHHGMAEGYCFYA